MWVHNMFSCNVIKSWRFTYFNFIQRQFYQLYSYIVFCIIRTSRIFIQFIIKFVSFRIVENSKIRRAYTFKIFGNFSAANFGEGLSSKRILLTGLLLTLFFQVFQKAILFFETSSFYKFSDTTFLAASFSLLMASL